MGLSVGRASSFLRFVRVFYLKSIFAFWRLHDSLAFIINLPQPVNFPKRCAGHVLEGDEMSQTYVSRQQHVLLAIKLCR